MSSIEERLVRDIAAVTGGVVVTDSDLREASFEVHERINRERRRSHLRTAAVAAAAAVVLVAAGITAFLLVGDDDATTQPARPAPTVSDPDADFLTGSAPTPQLIEGVWRLNDGGVLVRFTPNAAVQFDKLGTLFSHPVARGTYTINGDLISMTLTHGHDFGCLDSSLAMRVSLPEAGIMRYVPSEKNLAECSPMPIARGEWQQVLPTRSQEMAGFDNSDDPGWHPLSGKAALAGVFLAQGGGHLLELDRGGSYYVADDAGAPVDRGQWSLHGSDLTLTSAAGSTDCSKGDKLVLGGLEEVDPGTTVFRGTVKQNTCAAAWTPKEWIEIPNAGS
jgi:hypothetical protein